MCLFKRLFSSNETVHQNNFDWISLNDLHQLEEILTESYERTVVVFKHSTRCSISVFALNRFENDFHFSKEEILPFYLDLLSFREISNELATRFAVEHQSPQILVIKNGKAVFSTSHESINASILERFV